jgi:hypothetical protein
MSPTTIPPDLRLPALRRFATAITILNILGHTVLGFEPAWAHLVVALAATYATEIALEIVTSWSLGRRPRFLGGGVVRWVDFLLSAHITGCAISMLLYSGGRLMPVVFAGVVAICSKALLRAPAPGGGSRHFLNPSNFGIALTLVLFPTVGITPPYQFTANFHGFGDVLLPGLIILSGSFLNYRFTKRVPLILAWLGVFLLQAVVRTTVLGTATFPALLPATGMAFLLFTFYMVTDPATTPNSPRGQVIFGASVAITYSLLMSFHIVFGLFFALAIVTGLRGAVMALAAARVPATAPVPVSASAATLPFSSQESHG